MPTKIKGSKVLKQYPRIIEVLTQILRHFKRLWNPGLRKTQAYRATVKQVAKINKADLTVSFELVAALSFRRARQKVQPGSQFSDKPFPGEDLNSKRRDEVVNVNPGPDVATGRNPFQRIMEAIKRVPLDGFLFVINGFEPCPLRELTTEGGRRTRILNEPEAINAHSLNKTEIEKALPTEPEKEAV